MSLRHRLALTAAAATLAAGCAREERASEAGAAPATSGTPAPAATAAMDPLIDSLLGAFRGGLAEPDSLAGGATSRDALGAAFVQAVASRDTQALRALHVSRAEFAYLYFPSAPIALPPYGIDPALLWTQLTGTGARDLARAFDAVPRAARFVGLTCPRPPRAEGANRVHERCLAVVRRSAGAPDTLSLFGSILERDGRFKLLSFVNKL